MGTGIVPKPLSPTLGMPWDGGCLLPAAFLSGFVSTGLCSHPPNIHVGPFPPRGAANPPRNGPGIVDRAAISLEQASLGPAAAAGLRVTLSLPQPPRQSPCPPSVLSPPSMGGAANRTPRSWLFGALLQSKLTGLVWLCQQPRCLICWVWLVLAVPGEGAPGACQPAGRSPGRVSVA